MSDHCAEPPVRRGPRAAVLVIITLFLFSFAGLALAGTGGTEFQATYDMVVGWAQGFLGKLIAIAFLIVGIVAGVARQSIMAFAVGITAALGIYMTPDIIDSVVAATLPVTAMSPTIPALPLS